MSNNRITALAQELLDVIVAAEGDASEHFAALLIVSDAIRQSIARQKGLEYLQHILDRARNMYRMYGVVLSNYRPQERKPD